MDTHSKCKRRTGHEAELHQAAEPETGFAADLEAEPETESAAEQASLSGADDDRPGPGRQDEPLLRVQRPGRGGQAGLGSDDEEGSGASLRVAAAMPDGAGGGHTFAVGEPPVEEPGARSIRGQSAAVEADQMRAAGRTIESTRRHSGGWRGWTRSCCGRSGIAAKQRRWT